MPKTVFIAATLYAVLQRTRKGKAVHPRFEKNLVPEKTDDSWTSFHWFGLALMACFVVVWLIIYAKIMSMVGGTAP